MKRIGAIALLLSFGLLSCKNKEKSSCTENTTLHNTEAKNGPEKVEKTVGDFESIQMDGAFEIVLGYSEKSQLIVETTPSCEKELTITVKDKVLYVKMLESKRHSKMPKINLYVNASNIKSIVLNGANVLETEAQLKQEKLSMTLTGANLITMDLQLKQFNLSVEGANELVLKGSVLEFGMDSDGASLIRAFNLTADAITYQGNGAAKAELNAIKSLKVSNNGVGLVKYKGKPGIVSIENEGLGKVVKL